MIQLWSKRWSTARGWEWKLERKCSMEDSQEWLRVFKKGEPEVEFKLSNKKPKN